MPSTWRFSVDRVRHEAAVRIARHDHTDLEIEVQRLFEHARHRTERPPRGAHLGGVRHEALPLAVVAEPGRLEDRGVGDLGVGVGGFDDRVRSNRHACAVAGTASRRSGPERSRPPPATARRECVAPSASSAAAGGFSNSVVTTSHSSPSRRSASGSSYSATRWTSATAPAGACGSGSSTIVRYPIVRAAISAYRPSCPPPSMPIVAGGTIGRVMRRLTPAGASNERPVRAVRPGTRWSRSASADRRPPPASRPRTARRWLRRHRRSRTWPSGSPAGICTIESSESCPDRCRDATGTPSTGTSVFADSMPGRCAAPPAPAMIARRPRLAPPARRTRTSRRASDGRTPPCASCAIVEVLEHLDRLRHRRPVAGRSHDDADQR